MCSVPTPEIHSVESMAEIFTEVLPGGMLRVGAGVGGAIVHAGHEVESCTMGRIYSLIDSEPSAD